MKKKNNTINEEIELLEFELKNLYECKRLMPEDTFIGNLSIDANILVKEHKLKKLKGLLNS